MSESSSSPSSSTCRFGFRKAFTLSEEGNCDQDKSTADEKVAILLDIRRTFAPDPAWAVNTIKLLLFVVCFGWTVYNAFSAEEIDGSPRDAFFLVYLSNWGLILSSLYLLCSLLCSALRNNESLDILRQPSLPNEPPSRLVFFTWSLGVLIYHTEVVITVLYWGFVYTPDDNFNAGRAIMVHGIVMVLVAVDVVFVNNTPIRFAQLRNTMILGCIFVAWSGIYSALHIDNGRIYKVLDWRENALGVVILVALFLLILTPLCFAICWAISPLCRQSLWIWWYQSSSCPVATTSLDVCGVGRKECTRRRESNNVKKKQISWT